MFNVALGRIAFECLGFLRVSRFWLALEAFALSLYFFYCSGLSLRHACRGLSGNPLRSASMFCWAMRLPKNMAWPLWRTNLRQRG